MQQINNIYMHHSFLLGQLLQHTLDITVSKNVGPDLRPGEQDKGAYHFFKREKRREKALIIWSQAASDDYAHCSVSCVTHKCMCRIILRMCNTT